MTNKEARCWQLIAMFTIGSLIGMLVGGAVTDARINSEIRADQLELKEQVAEILADKVVVEDIVQTLLSLVDQAKAEKKSLEEIKILLSKGEENVK